MTFLSSRAAIIVDFRCPFHDCSTSGHKMATSRAKHATKEVFDLYRKYGDQDYIGEPVSQQEHMIQCAMLAEKEGYCDEVVLGVFLHDIGHLIGFDKSLPPMADVGTHAHEIIGEQFLKDLGFPDGVTSFVRGHVDAKRYLVCKYPQYRQQLTPASKKTLVFQGGPMTVEEAEKFEKLTHFEALIKMRKWDDQGKIKGAPVDSIDKYENMCKTFLEHVFTN